jgi:8-oxo-dGTP pyrophosphatase MutT (NUDIX family)
MSATQGSLAGLIPDFDPRRTPLIGRDHDLPPVASERLALPALRERLANPPPWQPELAGDPPWRTHATPRPAAVLVPIVARPGGATVLLTERTAHLRGHAGQVAFPGGGCDPQDAGPIDTALREAFEEVGLARERVEVIGQLPDYLTGSGYRVTPVVGIVESGFEARIDPFEVAEVFEVPIGFLMDPRHHERRRIVLQGVVDRSFLAMPWHDVGSEREHFIWGATAAMIRNLYRLLSA